MCVHVFGDFYSKDDNSLKKKLIAGKRVCCSSLLSGKIKDLKSLLIEEFELFISDSLDWKRKSFLGTW